MFPSNKTINEIPRSRVELHVHLDGSLRAETVWELAKQKNLPLPGNGSLSDLKKVLVCRDPVDLHHFLKPFLITTPCVRGDLAAIERVAKEFCEDKARNGVLYVEARYGPHGWLAEDNCKGRIDELAEVVRAVNRGFQAGEKEYGIKVRTILNAINSLGFAPDILKLCHMFRDEGVVGMDIAGNWFGPDKPYVEVPLSPEDIHAFEEAYKTGIHRTVHAGESGGADMIQRALDDYYAERIGHGYHVLDDDMVYDRVRKDQVHLEACPYSSLLTGSVSLKTIKHPIVRFAEDNVNFSINSDDTTVTGVDLQDEYELAQSWGLTEAHLVRANLNAARSSFLPKDEKSHLILKLLSTYGLN